MRDLFDLQEYLKAYQPVTLIRSWEEFFTGSIWQDIKMMLYADLVNRREELEDVNIDQAGSGAADVIRGNIEAIKRIIDMPNWIEGVKEDNSDESE